MKKTCSSWLDFLSRFKANTKHSDILNLHKIKKETLLYNVNVYIRVQM